MLTPDLERKWNLQVVLRNLSPGDVQLAELRARREESAAPVAGDAIHGVAKCREIHLFDLRSPIF